jgi:TPR repeat protein
MSRRIIGAASIAITVATGSLAYLNSHSTPPKTLSNITAQIGCPDGLIEDMSVGQCVPDGQSASESFDGTMAEQRRELANTLLTQKAGSNELGTAAELYRLAAMGGDTSAQFSLANMLAQGIGIEQDKTEALKWLREAALNGHAMAQVMWGAVLINGEEIEKDVAEGSRWVLRGMAKLSEKDPTIEPMFVGT